MGSVRKSPRTAGRPKNEVRWEARYRDVAGRQRTKTFPTQGAAKAWLATVEADLLRGDFIDPALSRIKFEDWAKDWRATIVHLEPNTVAFYDWLLRAHVKPAFDGLPIGAIDQPLVKRFVAEMVRDGAGPRTVQGAYQTLRHVMATAIGAGAVRANPCDGVRVPRLAQREVVFLTARQVLDLSETIRKPYGMLVTFAAYTGLRAGEIGGLRVGRLDLLRGKVDVVEALKDTNGVASFGPPKTHQRRTVTLPRFLCEQLAAYLVDRPHEPGDLVFTAPRGGPLQHRGFYQRTFRPAVRDAKLPEALRFHDLRHTCAALLIEQGAHPRAIMERLGHSNITVTMNTYGHLFPKIDESLTARLDAVYLGVTSTSRLSVVTS